MRRRVNMGKTKGNRFLRTAGNVFAVIFIYFAFMLAAGAVRSFLGLESSDAEYLSVSIANIALCIVLPLVVRKNIGRSIRERIGTGGLSPLDIVMALFAVYAVPRLLMHLEGVFLASSMTLQSGSDDEWTVIFFLAAVVIGPVAEEIFFRYAVMEQLKEILPRWIVILLASLFFAALHGYNIQGFTCMFVFFALSSVFYEWKRNLAFTVVLHIVYNLVVYILEAKAFDAFWEAVSRTENGFIIYRPMGLLILGVTAVAAAIYFYFRMYSTRKVYNISSKTH